MKSRVNLWIIASVIISDDTAPLTGCFFYVNSKLRQQFTIRVLGRSPRRKGSGKRRRRLERGEGFPLLYKNQQHSFYKTRILRNEVPAHHGSCSPGCYTLIRSLLKGTLRSIQVHWCTSRRNRLQPASCACRPTDNSKGCRVIGSLFLYY